MCIQPRACVLIKDRAGRELIPHRYHKNHVRYNGHDPELEGLLDPFMTKMGEIARERGLNEPRPQPWATPFGPVGP